MASNIRRMFYISFGVIDAAAIYLMVNANIERTRLPYILLYFLVSLLLHIIVSELLKKINSWHKKNNYNIMKDYKEEIEQGKNQIKSYATELELHMYKSILSSFPLIRAERSNNINIVKNHDKENNSNLSTDKEGVIKIKKTRLSKSFPTNRNIEPLNRSNGISKPSKTFNPSYYNPTPIIVDNIDVESIGRGKFEQTNNSTYFYLKYNMNKKWDLLVKENILNHAAAQHDNTLKEFFEITGSGNIYHITKIPIIQWKEESRIGIVSILGELTKKM